MLTKKPRYRARLLKSNTNLVIPEGFEPATHRLEICCSILLSYGTGLRQQSYKNSYVVKQICFDIQQIC